MTALLELRCRAEDSSLQCQILNWIKLIEFSALVLLELRARGIGSGLLA